MKMLKIIGVIFLIALGVVWVTAEPESTGTSTKKAEVSEEPVEQVKEEKIVGKDFSSITASKPTTVRNDVTGNYRLITVADNFNIEEYAADYYNRYFESDKEVHAIVNFTLNTTTSITVLGDDLNVCIHEYVKKEEHDAKILFGGTVLAEYFVNKNDGTVEKIQ